MIKTFKKALAIMMTIVFAISLVPTFALAEEGEIKTASFAFSNTERIDYGYTVASSSRYGEWNHRPTNCYMRSNYPTFVQIDLTGYEEVLKNKNTKVYMNLIQASSNYPLTGNVDVYLAADNCDQLNFSDATTFNHNIAMSSKFTSKERPVFFSLTSITSPCSSGELSPDTLVTVLDENNANSKIALYMQGSAKGSLSKTTSFNIIYDEKEIDNQDYVNDLANKLTWNIISSDAQNNVASKLNLPKKFYGADVTWTSTNENAINPSSGEVTINPESYTYVTLTASLKYTNFNGDYAEATTAPFVVRITKPIYDYSTGTGTFHNGTNAFVAAGSLDNGHFASAKAIGGIAGKTQDDLCYEIRDASGKQRYDLKAPTDDSNDKRDIIEFSICIPDGCYGYWFNIEMWQKLGTTDKTGEESSLYMLNDGIYNSRKKEYLYKWDGNKWHHVAIVAPGIVSSDGNGIVYDKTFKIYVDGNLVVNNDLSSTFDSPYGVYRIQSHGLCPIESYDSTTKTFSTIACYIDNYRWTNDLYVADYNTKSSVASTYDIDTNSDMLTVVTEGTTAKDIVDSLTIDEDATARVYDSEWNLLEDTTVVSDECVLVVADTNGTTSERSYAYYDIRVIENGEFAFDLPYITKSGDAVNGTVKLFNNSGSKKTYKIFLAVYSAGDELLEVKPKTLEVESGNNGSITTDNADFTDGNYAKLFIWEDDDITPALSSVHFK